MIEGRKGNSALTTVISGSLWISKVVSWENGQKQHTSGEINITEIVQLNYYKKCKEENDWSWRVWCEYSAFVYVSFLTKYYDIIKELRKCDQYTTHTKERQ